MTLPYFFKIHLEFNSAQTETRSSGTSSWHDEGSQRMTIFISEALMVGFSLV